MRTERGLDRLVNFSDATVAIAITLLILPLVDVAGKVGTVSFAEFWADNFDPLFTFAVSFAVIANFWVAHHWLFEWVEGYNTALIWVNFLWLATIVFIPFTANVLSSSERSRPEVFALYIGTLVVSSASIQALSHIILRSPGLAREGASEELEGAEGWATALVLVLALVLAVLFPAVGMWWLLLLFLVGRVRGLLSALTRRTSHRAR